MATVQGRQCSILVVEDNELLRLTVAEYLRDSGFDVLEASNGDEAIFMLKGDACAAINIVFSDIRMPGSTDGFGLARWVRAHRPEARIILASGYISLGKEAANLGHAEIVVQKPYSCSDLARRVRTLVGVVEQV